MKYKQFAIIRSAYAAAMEEIDSVLTEKRSSWVKNATLNTVDDYVSVVLKPALSIKDTAVLFKILRENLPADVEYGTTTEGSSPYITCRYDACRLGWTTIEHWLAEKVREGFTNLNESWVTGKCEEWIYSLRLAPRFKNADDVFDELKTLFEIEGWTVHYDVKLSVDDGAEVRFTFEQT